MFSLNGGFWELEQNSPPETQAPSQSELFEKLLSDESVIPGLQVYGAELDKLCCLHLRPT